MRIVFLDIDGVIDVGCEEENEQCFSNLVELCKKHMLDVVLSSSRRSNKPFVDHFKEKLKSHDINLVGLTPQLPISEDIWSDRIDEILHWVREYNPEYWLIIDDLDLMSLLEETRHKITREEFQKHFIKTDFYTGLIEDLVRI